MYGLHHPRNKGRSSLTHRESRLGGAELHPLLLCPLHKYSLDWEKEEPRGRFAAELYPPEHRLEPLAHFFYGRHSAAARSSVFHNVTLLLPLLLQDSWLQEGQKTIWRVAISWVTLEYPEPGTFLGNPPVPAEIKTPVSQEPWLHPWQMPASPHFVTSASAKSKAVEGARPLNSLPLKPLLPFG